MSFILVEYVCPGCGERFESLEERPAPTEKIHRCGYVESSAPGVLQKGPLRPHHAGNGIDRVKWGKAELAISAPKPQIVSRPPTPVARGKSDPLPPRALNTSPLADGMKYREWRKRRSEMWQNERFKQVKRELG